MKNLLIMTVTLFALAAPIAGRADSGKINQFVGLWEAVDPDDGSHQILSITDNADGTAKLRLFDTYFTLCNGGRAIGEGTAQAEKNRSLSSVDFTVTCFEPSSTHLAPTTLSKNPDGTLTRDRASLSPLIYHQTDK
ncbi:MAG TPA: hypothetical protein VIE65_17085 [Methylobacter sp.]